MSAVKFERKLAAILYADVAGYSRLTEQDEAGTHVRVLSYKRLLSEQILKYDGHVVHSEGDSLLADFSNANNALICALVVQKTLSHCNSELPEHDQVQFRIGINLCEVNIDSARQRVFGYGVNVAARLESLAQPGGVSVSESVKEAISAALPVKIEFLGVEAVKNISQPLSVFSARLEPVPSLEQITDSSNKQKNIASVDLAQTGFNTDSAYAISIQNHQSAQVSVTSDVVRNPVVNTTMTGTLSQRLLEPVIGNKLYRRYQPDFRDAEWREGIAQNLDRASGLSGIVVHARFLERWLRWNRRRFGAYRRSVPKTLDFALLYAFFYSSLFFFIGLIFLQGDAYVGELLFSYMEAGPQAFQQPHQDPLSESVGRSGSSLPMLPGEAGTLPLLMLIVGIYAFADHLRRRFLVASPLRTVFDVRRAVLWIMLTTVIAFTLALNGLGAGLVVLAVAIGAPFLRDMPGSGFLYIGLAIIVTLSLNFIVSGAEAGEPAMQAIAQALHDLIRDDVDRFLLMWLLFPIINALFDTLSWRLSRRLGLALRSTQLSQIISWKGSGENKRSKPRESSYFSYWMNTMYWGLLDLAIALLLLIGVATTVGAALEIVDFIRRDNTGYYSSESLIKSLISDPLGQAFWFTAMLVTTLLPTAMHLIAVGLGLINALAQPVVHSARLSSVLMYGPAHPLFDMACRQAAWYQFSRAVRTVTLTLAWSALLGWLVMSMLGSGTVLQILGASLHVGEQFSAIMIDVLGLMP